MTNYTLQLKHRVIDLRPSSHQEQGAVSEKSDPQPGKDGSGIAIPTDGRDRQILILTNRVKALEAALQKAREEAFQVGYEEGKDTAQREAKRQMEDLSEEFTAMIQSLKDQFDRAIEKMNRPLVKLGMKIAENIIGRELRHKEDYDTLLSRRIRQLLQEVADQNKVTIYINPNQIDWVSQTEIFGSLNLPSNIRINFVGDSKVKAGECLLETEDYILEGILSRELDYLEDQFLGREKR
jgi:flagellar assembly protein FliH